MKQLLLVIFITLSTISANSQGWMWSKQFTGAGQNQPIAVTYDATGCSYVYGNFNLTVNQDAYTLTSSGPQDIYLAKYDQQGQILWLKQFGGTASETAISMEISKDGSFLYLSGFSSSNPCSFDGNNLVTTGSSDIFLAKYAIDGSQQWVENVAYGTDQQNFGNFTIDQNNNIILTGHFLTSVTFYGGATTLNSSYPGIRQSFISSFDQNGSLKWAKMISGDNASTTIRSVSSDNSNYYFSGISVGNVLFDVGTISASGWDGFLYKTDINGNGQWVRKIMGSSNEIIWRHKGDSNGNQYLSGHYNSSSITIDSTNNVISNGNYTNLGSATNDIFLMKYNSNGTLQWAKSIGSTSDDLSYNIEVNSGNSIITGSYAGTMAFDSFSLTSSGVSDAFLIECNSTGQFLTAKKIGGKANDIGKTSSYSSTGRNFVTTGEFYSDTLVVGANQFINASTLRDSYITKYGCFDSTHFDVSPMSCIDGGGIPSDDGAVSATPSIGNAPYTYSWSNGASTAAISGLGLGNYTCTINGTNGCNLVKTATVTLKPVLQAAITSSTNVSCFGLATGSATVTASDGNPSYYYNWSNGASTQTISNVVAGIYNVTVSDQCGAEVVKTVTITQPSVLTASISSQTNISCYGGANGAATASPVGGTSPYSYLWNDPAPAQTTVTCTALIAGTWTVTVTDTKGCTITTNVTITQPATALTTSITSQVNVLCNGGSNGSAKVTPVGGTSPYTYLWNDPAPQQTTGICSALTAGTWTVTVTDNNGCTSTSNATITQPAAISLSISSQTNVLCYGGATGSTTVSVSGGTPGYNYLWNNPAPGQTTATCSALTAGTWTATVTDINGCTSTKSATITQPNQLQISVSSTNAKSCANDGTATATPTFGTSPYTYIWKRSGSNQTVGTTATISSLAPATYNVTVTDNCSATIVSSIAVVANAVLSSASCVTYCSTTSLAPCNGYAIATAVGGNLPLTYEWNTTPVQTTQETSHTLCADLYRYKVTITDACNDSKTSNKRRVSLCAKSVSSSEFEFTENINKISMFPNPVSTQLSILVENDENIGETAIIEVEIYNLLGELISREQKEIFYGNSILKDVSYLTPGLYMVTVIDGEERFTQRVLIQK